MKNKTNYYSRIKLRSGEMIAVEGKVDEDTLIDMLAKNPDFTFTVSDCVLKDNWGKCTKFDCLVIAKKDIEWIGNATNGDWEND